MTYDGPSLEKRTVHPVKCDIKCDGRLAKTFGEGGRKTAKNRKMSGQDRSFSPRFKRTERNKDSIPLLTRIRPWNNNRMGRDGAGPERMARDEKNRAVSQDFPLDSIHQHLVLPVHDVVQYAKTGGCCFVAASTDRDFTILIKTRVYEGVHLHFSVTKRDWMGRNGSLRGGLHISQAKPAGRDRLLRDDAHLFPDYPTGRATPSRLSPTHTQFQRTGHAVPSSREGSETHLLF